jgi:type I restriction enzyme S subunit
MSFPRYPAYKPSGVEWLGEVPEHWEVLPLKRKARLLTEKTVNRSNPVALENVESWTGKLVETETEFQGEGISFEAGDILFGKLRPYLAKVYLASSSGEAVGDFHVIHSSPSLLPRLLQYHLLNREVIDLVNSSTYGAKMPRASWSFLGSIDLPVPPLHEQPLIAAFLDRETAKIDALIAEQQRLIELLQEKRQAVISHAVTKGLNPDAPMKDSGVEWLGEVPEHWGTKPLKHLCPLLRDGTHLPPPRASEGVPLLSVRNIQDEEFVLREDDSLISVNDYLDLCRSFTPLPGDILLAIVGATMGKAAAIPEDLGRFHIQRSLGIFRTQPAILRSEWLLYVFRASSFQGLLWRDVSFSAQPGIYLGTLKDISIPVPPTQEQAEILEYSHNRLDSLRELIATATEAIEIQKERRSALISAAVTGQIDVRGLVPEASAA